MKTLIKNIRNHLGISQAEFAKRLNISFATANRWENGHALPNKLAQAEIYAFCKENNVPVYDFLLAKIKAIAETVSIPKKRMLLYHASKTGISGKIRPQSRLVCDFGQGFYMGDNISQALTLICDYEDSKFYIVSIDVSKLETLKLKADLDWAMLVALHRDRMEKIKGTRFYEKYENAFKGKDLIIGSIANDRIFYVLDTFFMGNITDAALVASLSALRLGKQYVAITQKSCDCIKIEKAVELSHLERLFMKDVAEENRFQGMTIAKEICKDRRREGLFFDEILEQATKKENAK